MKFEIKEEFLIDGKETKLISGSIHYFRIPREKWYQSLYNLKAMGANCVETYIPWNFHEPKKDQFEFSGDKDIEYFIQLATELGLYIILRPAAYICAEWEYGGFPAWLLKEDVRVRSQQKEYMTYLEHYYSVLLPKLAKYQFTQGGNVLMMQIENEYGSFSNDKTYLKMNRDLMVKYGINVPLFTSDGPSETYLIGGALLEENILPTINFGSQPDKCFDNLVAFNKKYDKKLPLMCMEFWDGWFNNWGKPVEPRDPKETAEAFAGILKRGSVNMYMFHGGTNFGFMNGANQSFEDGYWPQVTSYDYDAPLDEQGNPTAKFYAFREVVKQFRPDYDFPEPMITTGKEYETVKISEKVSLFNTLESLGTPVENDYPLTMEKLDQEYGYLLYETAAPLNYPKSKFQIVNASDRAQVFLDGKKLFTRTETDMEQTFTSEDDCMGKKLQVLMENRGRVNYGPFMYDEHQNKGILGGVRQEFFYLSGWNHYSLPLDNLEKVDYQKNYETGTPSFYRGFFEVEEIQDTFIDLSHCGKGVVFINGINLGRFWDVGPFYTTYLPGAYLQKGKNEIVIFETEGVEIKEVKFSATPIRLIQSIQ